MKNSVEKGAERRRLWWAVLASLLVHLSAVLILASLYLSGATAPPEEVDEIEIVMMEAPAPPAPPRFVETEVSPADPPESAAFQSDRDTAAASPELAQGEVPLPTQEGREQQVLELEEQMLALAKPDIAPPAPVTPPSQEVPPVPFRTELAQVQPEKKEEKILERKPEALLAAADPSSQPREPKEESPPPAPPPTRPSFQRQARATRLRGSVDSTGRTAVASLATPLGRYRKTISDAVGSSWYHYIGPRMDMFRYGSVKVVFLVESDGRVRRPRVISNTSNESFENITLAAILDAQIPPIPPDVLPTLQGGRIEIDFSFSIITN